MKKLILKESHLSSPNFYLRVLKNYVENTFIREFEYIFKLGNGWVPKTPKAAPYEIKILLDKCLEYCVDKRAPAAHLLKIIDNFVSMIASNKSIEICND